MRRHRSFTLTVAALVVLITLAVAVAVTRAQHGTSGHSGTSGMPRHEMHGTPAGWTFTLPKGDAAKGRAVFAKLECYSCHEVKGENFPRPSGDKIGPELASMAGHHPPEFFAESIVNPSAVIDKGQGYEGPDGSSKMPSFNDSMTVQELVDLVAFIQALKPPAAAPAAHGSGSRH